MTVRAKVIDEVSPDVVAEWDRLAVTESRPLSAPAWALGWWKHVQHGADALRIVVAWDDDELLGILPLTKYRRVYTRMGGDLLVVEPLVKRGREVEVADAMDRALNGLGRAAPMLRVEFQDDSPPWGILLTEGWPGPRTPFHRVDRMVQVPRVALNGLEFDEWLSTKSSNFRSEVRRKARRLEEDGAEFRLASSATLHDDLEAFMRLHRLRHPRGTNLGSVGVREMLEEVGRAHLSSRRFRLLCLKLDGETVAAILLAAAGDEVVFWNSGMDDAVAHRSPVTQCLIFSIREMTERKEGRLNLGPGSQGYKSRLANDEGTLTTVTIIPRESGYAKIRALDQGSRSRVTIERSVRRRLGKLKRRLQGT